VTQNEAERIVEEWLTAWNGHDLDRIMEHYAERVEFTSPFVLSLLGESSGTLRGRAALREYSGRALAAYPDLHFEPLQVFAGVRSLVAQYRSVRGLIAAETMLLDEDGRVCRVLAHYSELPRDASAPPGTEA
jgi:ketosteroid isomerase-like protein